MRISVVDAARAAPDRPALIFGEQTWSYSELAERVRAHAAAIESMELSPEHRLGLAPRLLPADVVTLFAAIELGRPLVLAHPRSSPAEREKLLQRAQPLRWVEAEELAAGRGTVLGGAFDSERILAIFFTSGTTGTPKGAMLSHRAFLASARASEARLGWTDEDRWYASLPLAHVGGISILIRCLLARRPIVLPESASASFDPKRLIDEVDKHRITLLSLVPAMLDQVLELDPHWRPPQLRVLLLGGAAASSALLDRAAQAGLPVSTTYGLTEACSQVATRLPGTTRSDPGVVGRPLPGVEVQIRSGRIHVRGPTMMSGYLPETVGSVFDREAWFDTQDLGSIGEDGELAILGRGTDLIVTGGENVHPAEVEAVLDEHPAVRECCVVGLPDERWGETVAALIVPEGRFDLSDLDAWCRSRLASFRRPRRIELCSALPRTAIGKIDRSAVRSRFSSRREED